MGVNLTLPAPLRQAGHQEALTHNLVAVFTHHKPLDTCFLIYTYRVDWGMDLDKHSDLMNPSSETS